MLQLSSSVVAQMCMAGSSALFGSLDLWVGFKHCNIVVKVSVAVLPAACLTCTMHGTCAVPCLTGIWNNEECSGQAIPQPGTDRSYLPIGVHTLTACDM